MIQAINEVGSVFVQYNKQNLPSSVTYPDGRKLLYEYNKLKQRTLLADLTTGHNITYHYDKLNRLAEILVNGSRELQIEYNSLGQVHKRILGNGGYTMYEYDTQSNRLLKLTNVSPDGSVSTKFEYGYDRKGRRVIMNSTQGSWKYKYDAAMQLTEWSSPRDERGRYVYDERRNRVFSETGAARSKASYVTNKVNQYSSAGETEYTYDSNGNLASKMNI